MDYIVRTKNLKKQFKDKMVVEDVNITIKRGEIYGFLGPNGSGKTTTLRMILGLITPTSGEVELFGKTLKKGEMPPYERVGNLMVPSVYGNLTVIENLNIHGRLMGYTDQSRKEEILEMVGLLEEKTTLCKKLSLGMKQRLGIARAVLHKPELLILDEPMNAIDPKGTKKIREGLVTMAQKYQTTILMSTHLLNEIELMATKIGIISQGKLLEELDYARLQNKNKEYLELRVNPVQKAIFILENEMHLKDYEVVDENKIRLFEGIGEPNQINHFLMEKGVTVVESRLSKDKLESYFLELIGGEGDA